MKFLIKAFGLLIVFRLFLQILIQLYYCSINTNPYILIAININNLDVIFTGIVPSKIIDKPFISCVVIWFFTCLQRFKLQWNSAIRCGDFLKRETIGKIVSVINLSLYFSFCYYYLVIIILIINNSLLSLIGENEHFPVRKISFWNLKQHFGQYFL